MASTKLYIDVTQLVHWPGRLTGIPRVMNELAIRYEDDEDVTFTVWDNHHNQFYEIDISKTLSSRGQRIEYTNVASNKAGELITNLFSTTAYTKLENKLPGTRTMRRARGAIKRANLTPLRPQSGSCLLILWGEWGDDKYISYLKILCSKKVKLVQVAYDLLPIVTPQYSGHSTESMIKYNRSIMPLCDLILSISESTKKDLIKWLKGEQLSIPAIKTFRLGDDFKFCQPKKPEDTFFSNRALKGKDYILCVGTIEARKNHNVLYYAYKLAASKKINLPKLVIVGRRGWKTDNIYDIMTEDPQTKDQMVMLTNMSDEELSWLYQNALFSVYPSFYEGWGLPVAESALHRLPCLCSNTSSLPEIAGNLVNYFNPASSDECLKGILHLLNPAELKKQTKELEKYQVTTWDDTYIQVNNHIRELRNAG